MKYRFCYQCGHPAEQANIEGRIRTFCPACRSVLFENPVPSVAILTENDRNEVLPGDDIQEAQFFNIYERPRLIFSIYEHLLKR